MKIKYFITGIISLIIFGLLLPQPIQALFVYTSLKSFFDSHLVLLCILVGGVQGVLEECGYYVIMKKIYNKDQKEILPFWFGLGRGVLHTIFDIGSVVLVMTSIESGVVSIISRLIGLCALLVLTNLDFIAFKNNRIYILGISILLHLVMNGMIYANELELLHFSDSFFIFGYSAFVIILGYLIMRLNRVFTTKKVDA
ncbi:MAG: YhfC family glutamic-type intramembrane protease [Lachnospiraceae bacterium]